MFPIEFTAPRAIVPVFLRYASTTPSVASEYIAGSIAFLSFLSFWPRTAAEGLLVLANIRRWPTEHR